MAPSILIAIITKPMGGPSAEAGQTAAVPMLQGAIERLVGVTADAQTPKASTDHGGVPIEVLVKPDAKTSLWSLALSALGWKTDSNQYVYVVGKTDNEGIAKGKASAIDAVLQRSKHSSLSTKILKTESGSQFYLTIGDGSQPPMRRP